MNDGSIGSRLPTKEAQHGNCSGIGCGIEWLIIVGTMLLSDLRFSSPLRLLAAYAEVCLASVETDLQSPHKRLLSSVAAVSKASCGELKEL